MDLRQTGLGIVLLLVFWAFQMGFFSSLGTAGWFLAAVIFVGIVWAIGKGVMPKPSATQKELWMFVSIVALVLTALIAFVPPSLLGVTSPPPVDQRGAIVLTLLLTLFGAAMLVTGWEMKWNVTMLVGVFWLFVATHLYTLAPVAWIHFGVITSLPFIIYGLMRKD